MQPTGEKVITQVLGLPRYWVHNLLDTRRTISLHQGLLGLGIPRSLDGLLASRYRHLQMLSRTQQ